MCIANIVGQLNMFANAGNSKQQQLWALQYVEAY